MTKHLNIRENKHGWQCPYDMRNELSAYGKEQVLPNNICPWLYHSVYPYMLGLLYGADFRYNENGDANVNCPAADGCQTLVRKRPFPNDVITDNRIDSKNNFVIYAEIIKVGTCPSQHVIGEIFLFPTCLKEHHLCPAAWYQAFPLMNLLPPDCVDLHNIRCPDWELYMTIDIKSK
jgi:uncharacterized repeat protein (TIGR04076 family)